MFKSLKGYDESQVRATQFIRNVKFGKNVTVAPFVNLYDCEIGDDVFIGPYVEIQSGSKIGDRCRIQSHSFICSHVTIGNDVFIGHGVMFIDDKYPRANKPWTPLETRVCDNASIGSNATILPVKIGIGSMVGAGSTVTKDVADGRTVAGNPARLIRTSI